MKSRLRVHIPFSWIDTERHLFLEWTPQRFILEHRAIRLFISHGGWNSMLESMLFGKPTLVWPLFGDQIINGHRLEHELGMGRCIQNTHITNNNETVSSDQLAQYIKEIFDHEAEYVKRAQQAQKMVLSAKQNSSRLYLEEIMANLDSKTPILIRKHNEL